MSDIVKGVLGGGWSLIVGWILPTSVNVLIFVYLVVPDSKTLSHAFTWLTRAADRQTGLALLTASVLGGLLLAALQTQLYRLLEGYIGWRPQAPDTEPGRFNLLERSHRRLLERKQILVARLDLVELTALEAEGPLNAEDSGRLAEVRADVRLVRYADVDKQRTASQLGLLRERVQRFPVSDTQVVPTRLGNAIRRLEEYGYDRYSLDSQRLWYELTAVGPGPAVKQVDQARTTVDFLVALLYGHILVAAIGLVVASVNPNRPWVPLIVAGCLLIASRVWYEVAVRATDDWAAAVRALVNTSRLPLAQSLGLKLPNTFEGERRMWGIVHSLVSRPYSARREALDNFRAETKAEQDTKANGNHGISA